MNRQHVVRRELTFNFAHRLADAPNLECYQVHGHEVMLTVEGRGMVPTVPIPRVRGPNYKPTGEEGMLISFSELKRAMMVVHDLFDHRPVFSYHDPIIEMLFRKRVFNNQGWADFRQRTADQINRDGFYRSSDDTMHPFELGLKMIVIAENPTSENMSYLIHQLLGQELHGSRLTELKVTFGETRKCAVSFTDKVSPKGEFPQIED